MLRDLVLHSESATLTLNNTEIKNQFCIIVTSIIHSNRRFMINRADISKGQNRV